MIWLLLLLGCAGTVVGNRLDRRDSQLPTYAAVAITYSSCTTELLTTKLAVSPVTEFDRVFLDWDGLGSITPTTSYITTSMDIIMSTLTTFGVQLINPSDLPPIGLASRSAVAQPHNCLRATTTVDYRQACETGKDYEKENEWSIKCGELNPCCYDCLHFDVKCIFGYCDDRDYLLCFNGVKYYEGGGTGVDSQYHLSYPTMALSEYTQIPTTGTYPKQPIATATTDPTASVTGSAEESLAATSTGSAETDDGEKLSCLAMWAASLVAAIMAILVL